MLKRWIGYLLAVTCCLVFYWAHGQWMSYMILLALLGLPAVSLLISLPAMIKTRLECGLPDRITMEQEASAEIAPQGPKVFPPWRVKARISHNFTGLRRSLLPGQMLPAQHCGQIRVTVKYARVYDHLGLFFLKKPMPKEHTITVLPLPQRPARIPDTSSCAGVRLCPRPGGGFAENHDLRLYRPGDDLRQIHWKMTAKTGKIILREALQTLHSPMVLRLDVTGAPEELDRKMGELLYLSRHLLQKGFPHAVQAWTAEGLISLSVSDEESLLHAMDQLLSIGQANSNQVLSYPADGDWWHYIGGDSHEKA